jgi:hypothetical protein
VIAKSEITSLTRRLKKAEKRAEVAERELADVISSQAGAILKYRALRPSTSLLADSLTPDAPIPTRAQALQGQQNAEARWKLLKEFGAYTSGEIGDHRSRAKNRHALASRWRTEGKIFHVEYHGQRLFPSFQFDTETFDPQPVVALVLAALPRREMTDWEVALWWTADNGWLDGCRPVDLMPEDPDALVAAAAHLAEPPAL